MQAFRIGLMVPAHSILALALTYQVRILAYVAYFTSIAVSYHPTKSTFVHLIKIIYPYALENKCYIYIIKQLEQPRTVTITLPKILGLVSVTLECDDSFQHITWTSADDNDSKQYVG